MCPVIQYRRSIASIVMPPRKRSPAQLAAAARGTATSKARKLNDALDSVAKLTDDVVDELAHDAHVGNDLLKLDFDTDDEMPDLVPDHACTDDAYTRAFHYINKYMYKEQPLIFFTFTAEPHAR